MLKTMAVAVLLFAASVADAETVEEIVAKNATARGGAAAWRAVQSMRCAGSMELGKGLQVPFRLELKRPRKMRLEFDFSGATAVQTYDGSQGWKLAPYRGRHVAEPLTPEELASATSQAELDGALIDYAAKGHQLEVLGRESVEGREAVKLALTLHGGGRRFVYVDAATGLEVLVETTQRLRGEEKPVRTYLRDYRAVGGGLLLPHVLESRIEGSPYSHALRIASVELGAALPDARFGRPEAHASPAPAASAPRQFARTGTGAGR